MAQMAAIMSKEDVCRQRLLQAIQDYSFKSNASVGPQSIGDTSRNIATESTNLADMVNIACDGMAELWQALQISNADREKRRDQYPPIPHPEPMAGLNSVIASQRKIMYDEMNDQGVGPLPRSPARAHSLGHAGSVQINRYASMQSHDSHTSDQAGTARISMPSARSGVGSATGLSAVSPGVGVSPSSQLQARLKKAQQTFASMRESHE